LESFVFTNPSANTVLFPLDKVFVLSTTPITAGNSYFSPTAPHDANDYVPSGHTATSDIVNQPHTDLATLQRSQQRLQSSVQLLSEDMNHRFDGLMALLQKVRGENSSPQPRSNTATVNLCRNAAPRSSFSSYG